MKISTFIEARGCSGTEFYSKEQYLLLEFNDESEKEKVCRIFEPLRLRPYGKGLAISTSFLERGDFIEALSKQDVSI